MHVYESLRAYYFDEEASFGGERVHRLEIVGPHTLEIVYSRPEVDFLIGLRVQVQIDRDDEPARIVADNLGEPLGSSINSLRFDDDGIGWWVGRSIDFWDR